MYDSHVFRRPFGIPFPNTLSIHHKTKRQYGKNRLLPVKSSALLCKESLHFFYASPASGPAAAAVRASTFVEEYRWRHTSLPHHFPNLPKVTHPYD